MQKTNRIIYSLILLEGFIVLSTELLAIRLLSPFVGSSTDTIAVIIAAVLMPLAIGYYYGGHKKYLVKKKLTKNLTHALIFLSFGLSYLFLLLFFTQLENLHISNKVIQTTIYSCLFLIYPIFLLGQTIPLISNYLPKQNIAKITGKMLCCSTLGSFLGSIITTLLLMALIGVNYTVSITLFSIAIMIIMLNKTKLNYSIILIFLFFTFFINSNFLLKKFNIIANNQYNTIALIDNFQAKGDKILIINNSMSSRYNKKTKDYFAYVKFINNHFLLFQSAKEKKDILIIGAGGFTIGLDDHINNYTYIDIDPQLLPITEKYFLQKKLAKNKRFVATPARNFIRQDKKFYDCIILDAFTNTNSIPTQLITTNFFLKIKNHLKKDGVFVANIIASPNFATKYSIKLDNSLKAIFGHLNREIIQPYNAWQKNTVTNIIYSYYNKDYTKKTYSDLKNSYYLDH